MKFFEITPGRSIKLSEIEAIERTETDSIRIFTHHNTYEAVVPYSTMISILENVYEAEKEEKNTELLKEISNKVGQQGFFAG